MTTPTRAIPQTVLDNVFATRRGEAYWAARVELPQVAGDPAPVVLHVATALVTFAVPPVGGVGAPGPLTAFQPTLKPDSVGVKFSAGRSPDGGELTLENFTRTLGQTIAQVNRKIAGASVRVFKVWRVFGVDVADEVFTGYLRAPKVDGEAVKFPLVSDMSRRGEVVGGSLLTMRCKWLFKDGVHCTYAGPETFCSHVLDDAAEGCKAYGHEFEFDGVPTHGGTVTPAASAGEDGGPTGFGPPGTTAPTQGGRTLDRDFHPNISVL